MTSLVRVALIPCSAQKREERDTYFRACDLYTSPLFRRTLEVARATSDRQFIASALWDCVELDQRIQTYDRTVKDYDRKTRTNWGLRVVSRMAAHLRDYYPGAKIVLANYCGAEYCAPMHGNYPAGWEVSFPLEGLMIGQRLSYLNRAIAALAHGGK